MIGSEPEVGGRLDAAEARRAVRPASIPRNLGGVFDRLEKLPVEARRESPMSAPRLRARGKVRDIYEAGEDPSLLVATDRISAFDVVLPDPIPDKGRVLTGLSSFWFERTADLVPNHLVSADPPSSRAPFAGAPALAGRAMLVRKATVVPMECVARGYLAGSGWKQYRRTGAVCGVPLPGGLVESDRLPEPIFTPTTKADDGPRPAAHARGGRDLVGEGLAERLKELTLGVYERSRPRRSSAASSSPTRSSSSGSPTAS